MKRCRAVLQCWIIWPVVGVQTGGGVALAQHRPLGSGVTASELRPRQRSSGITFRSRALRVEATPPWFGLSSAGFERILVPSARRAETDPAAALLHPWRPELGCALRGYLFRLSIRPRGEQARTASQPFVRALAGVSADQTRAPCPPGRPCCLDVWRRARSLRRSGCPRGGVSALDAVRLEESIEGGLRGGRQPQRQGK